MKHCRYCKSGNSCRKYIDRLYEDTHGLPVEHGEVQAVGLMAETCNEYEKYSPKDLTTGKSGV